MDSYLNNFWNGDMNGNLHTLTKVKRAILMYYEALNECFKHFIGKL